MGQRKEKGVVLKRSLVLSLYLPFDSKQQLKRLAFNWMAGYLGEI